MSRLDTAIDAIEKAVHALSEAVHDAKAHSPAQTNGISAPQIGASEDDLRAMKAELQDVVRLLEDVQNVPHTKKDGQA